MEMASQLFKMYPQVQMLKEHQLKQEREKDRPVGKSLEVSFIEEKRQQDCFTLVQQVLFPKVEDVGICNAVGLMRSFHPKRRKLK